MPLHDIEQFTEAYSLSERRAIRIGMKSGGKMVKTKPRVTIPIKAKGEDKFDLDKDAMARIARRIGVSEPSQVDAIPVMLMTDDVLGESGVVYVERALYTGRGRLCGSPVGHAKAQQRVDVAAYARNKKIEMLDNRREVDCDNKCPMWADPGKKSDCGWRAIVSVQLADDPVFPSVVRFRTKSRNSIRLMISSLNAIKSVTGGVLMGIPLLFRQYKMDTKDAAGEIKRIDVMTFEFQGSVQELREYAARELVSRANVVKAAAGMNVTLPPADKKTRLTVIDDDDVGQDGEFDDGDVAVVADTPRAEDDVDDVGFEGDASVKAEINSLAAVLGYAPAALRALEHKHGLDDNAVLAELRSLSGNVPAAPGSSDWSAAEVGQGSDVEEEDDEFWDASF